MWRELRTAATMLFIMTAVTGGLYPAMVTAIGQTAFPVQAQGSLIREGGRTVGSELIGQHFQGRGYFWGRLSATSPVPFNAASSGGANLGPLNPELQRRAHDRLAALAFGERGAVRIPVDLVTASASGLDPHISPAAAELQVPRVAANRRMTETDVRALVQQHTLGRQWGLLGEPRVHVLRLNRALDEAHRRQREK